MGMPVLSPHKKKWHSHPFFLWPGNYFLTRQKMVCVVIFFSVLITRNKDDPQGHQKIPHVREIMINSYL